MAKKSEQVSNTKATQGQTNDSSKPIQSKASQASSAIRVIGPYDENNGSKIFRFYHDDGRKGFTDFHEGQVITVGDQVTQDEAERLLSNSSWEFKEVKE
jgi:hypothetical protein